MYAVPLQALISTNSFWDKRSLRHGRGSHPMVCVMFENLHNYRFPSFRVEVVEDRHADIHIHHRSADLLKRQTDRHIDTCISVMFRIT